MKSTRIPLTTLGPSLALACLLGGCLAQAQLADDAAAVKPPMLPGTYYSAQRPNYPPLPWNPFPELPLYSWGERRFIYDDREVDYSLFRTETAETAESAAPLMSSAYRSTMLTTTGGCWPNLLIFHGSNEVILLVTNGTAGETYELFATGCLIGDSMTNSLWRRVALATNGQRLTFSAPVYREKYFVVGCDTDSDNDGLTDAYEVLVTKTSLNNSNSVNTLYTDKEMENVPVNDPDQDCGNEQNSQFESTVAVLGSNVIVAYVDSNRGVYGLGNDGYGYLTNYIPRLVSFAVSTNGGATFTDMDVPPLDAAGFGDAGDPVLAVDASSNVVYLVGTSPRQTAAYRGVPFWKSTDGGLTFGGRTTVREDITTSDKPWIAVDDWPGTGRHDVYIVCTGSIGSSGKRIWLTVSTNGQATGWSDPVEVAGTNALGINSPIIAVDAGHTAYAFWFEKTGSVTNWIKMRRITTRGAALGTVRSITTNALVTTGSPNGNFWLRRSNASPGGETGDTFSVPAFPAVAVNPFSSKTGHLYVAYPDKPEDSRDDPDIYFVASINGGETWSARVPVNTVSTNDQWMPVIEVKPDGTQLFVGWYDRRNDTNNSLIEVYGRFATISTTGAVTFGSEFRISSVSFAPVFSGTLNVNTNIGCYDPVYPPVGVNLHWWYSEWSTNAPSLDQYVHHVGEYNGIRADDSFLWFTWTDYRLVSSGRSYRRNQADIRLLQIAWPQ